ncbi:permease [Desulfogranum marinum]|uniref:permease n=1 Tax=Desulfogranum marinum TaxID=453220 RepID=UPI0029C75346|nr:permease [Desulfogranum marinum]
MSQPKTISFPERSPVHDVLKSIDRVYVLVFAIFMGIAILAPGQVVPLGTLTLTNLAHTSMYMIIAIFLLAAIKATGAETMVASVFKGRENRMIVLAALVGGLAPFCSCEVIPFIAGLLALGTPLAPIMAFWLSSPLIDPPTLLITAGALGWKFAIGKSVFAVALGIGGGFAVKYLTVAGYLSNPLKTQNAQQVSSCCSPQIEIPMVDSCASEEKKAEGKPVWIFWKEQSRRTTFVSEFKSNALFLLKWMLFAYTLESLMIEYVPAERIASVVGGEGVTAIIISALVGIPAYLNSYIAPPVVSSLVDQGMSIGSGMAFIIAGAISSIPAMTAVYALVRREVFATYVMLGFSGAVLSGFIYKFIG